MKILFFLFIYSISFSHARTYKNIDLEKLELHEKSNLFDTQIDTLYPKEYSFQSILSKGEIIYENDNTHSKIEEHDGKIVISLSNIHSQTINESKGQFNFRNSVFKNQSFTNSKSNKMDITLSTFKNSSWVNLNLDKAYIEDTIFQSGSIQGVRFTNCYLKNVHFIDVFEKNLVFKNCTLINTTINGVLRIK